MGDRRLTLGVAVLMALGGVALVADWIANDPTRKRPAAVAPSPEAPGETGVRDAPELPSLGAVRVESTRDGLTVRANQARRSAILEALGRAGGFSVTGVPSSDPPLRLLLKVDDLRTAVVAVLGDAEHTLVYDSGSGVPTLVRVELGSDGPPPPGAARERGPAGADPDGPPAPSPGESAPDAGEVAFRSEPERYQSPSEIARIERRREEALEMQRQEDLGELVTGDADARAAAASRLDADDDDSLAALSKSMQNDPSSRVRIRAARRLGFGESARVLPVLTAGLADPDPDVVVEVIEALAFVGEREAIPSLERLAEHESPAVRSAASDAIEVLR